MSLLLHRAHAGPDCRGRRLAPEARTGARGVVPRKQHGPEYTGDWAWTPSGGARYPGEAVDACAARELYEEAGLTLPLTKLDDGEERWGRYIAEAPADAAVTLHDAEHDAFVWVSVDEALRMVRPAIVRDSIRAALASITP